MASVTSLAFALAAFAVVPSAVAATLPPHRPLDVFVIGDEVNPNNLSDGDLTQPEDIPIALNASDSGLELAPEAAGFDSQCVDEGLTRLESSAVPSVLVYFAHRAARHCAGGDAQAELVSALEAHLLRGGGMVVLHHGLYVAAGKEAILELIGAESNSIAWNTTQGQRVYNLAPEHFVTTYGVSYAASAAFPALGGVAAGTYEYFDNIPDERYPLTTLTPATDPERTLLFGSDSGGTRALGFVTVRSGWRGRVVAYQPGEYQPNALDDRDGNNFQILANAIVFAAGEVDADGQGGASAGSGGTSSTAGSNGGSSAGSAGIVPGAGRSSGGTSATGGAGSEAPPSDSSGGVASPNPTGGRSSSEPPLSGASATGGQSTGGRSAASGGAGPSGAASSGGAGGATSSPNAGRPATASPPPEPRSKDDGCALTRAPSRALAPWFALAAAIAGYAQRRGSRRRSRKLPPTPNRD